VYWYTVANFGLPFLLQNTPWSLGAGILLGNLSDALVRAVFIYRVYVLSDRKKALWITPTALLLIVLATGLAICIRASLIAKVPDADYTLVIWFFYINFVASVITDFFIAITLCWQLYKSRLGLPKTDSLVNSLITYTIGTGLLTSVASVACVAAYAASPGTYIFWVFYFPLSKLYINALLASLNTRDSLRRKLEVTAQTVTDTGSFRVARPTDTGLDSAVHHTGTIWISSIGNATSRPSSEKPVDLSRMDIHPV